MSGKSGESEQELRNNSTNIKYMSEPVIDVERKLVKLPKG